MQEDGITFAFKAFKCFRINLHVDLQHCLDSALVTSAFFIVMLSVKEPSLALYLTSLDSGEFLKVIVKPEIFS
ncbi:hypothetical protein A7M65_19565 [Acinetobacter baumannii]|nr:hypothetical protein A7M65_19565 [Acinetobacter baumannii]